MIVIGATNRPEVLDQALLRPGRFDRRVAVQPPIAPGVRRSSRCTRAASRSARRRSRPDRRHDAGMVGADLANLVNEAALLPRDATTTPSEADFTDALERILLGAERQ